MKYNKDKVCFFSVQRSYCQIKTFNVNFYVNNKNNWTCLNFSIKLKTYIFKYFSSSVFYLITKKVNFVKGPLVTYREGFVLCTCKQRAWGRGSQKPGSQKPGNQYLECRDSPVERGIFFSFVPNKEIGTICKVWILLGQQKFVTDSVHNHAADLQDRHVGLLALISLPHDGTHSLQARVGAVQPGNMTLRKKYICHNINLLLAQDLQESK